MRAWLIGCLFLGLSLILAGCVSGQMYTERVEEAYPPIGEYVAFRDGRVHVIRRGERGAAPVLMIHGASANAREYLITLVPELEDQSLDLLLADRPGHGYSSRVENAADLGVQAAAMAKALEEMTDEPAVIVGHSFGGAVALRLALDHPEKVKALILLAPVTHDWGDGGITWYNRLAAPPVFGALFSQLAPQVGPGAARDSLDNLFSPAEPPENYADNMGVDLLFRPAVFRANARDLVTLKAQLAEQQKRYDALSMPIIIYSGTYDTVIKPKLHAARLQKTLPDTVTLLKLDDEGHMPHHGKADEIADAILRLARAESVQ